MESGGRDGSVLSSAARRVRSEDRQVRERGVSRDWGEPLRSRLSWEE